MSVSLEVNPLYKVDQTFLSGLLDKVFERTAD